MTWIALLTAIAAAATAAGLAHSIGGSPRGMPRWSTRKHRAVDRRRLALTLGVAVLLGVASRGYDWSTASLFQSPTYVRGVTLAVLALQVVIAARAGRLAHRVSRISLESVGMSAAFSAGLLAIDLTHHGMFAGLDWRAIVGILALAWWMALGLCLVVYGLSHWLQSRRAIAVRLS
jgi:hypothetical protein